MKAVEKIVPKTNNIITNDKLRKPPKIVRLPLS
jgi:hypothetical protein